MTANSRRRMAATAVVGAGAVFVSCNSDGSTMPPGNIVPSIAVGVNPQSTSVPQGGSTQIAATITKTNFSGAVVLSVSGAPASISVSISQPPVTGAVAAGLITLTATSQTSPGTYNLTIQAAATGVSAASTPFVLTVTSVGSYAVAAASSGLALVPGSSGTVQIAITREQFTLPVNLEAIVPPGGVTGTFAPNPVIGNSATLTLTIAANASLGQHNVEIRGTSAGSPQRSIPFVLSVGPLTTFVVSASPITVTIARGTSQTVALQITRGSAVNTSITLSIDGAPQGLTPALDPALVSGTTSTLTLTAAANLAPRMYVLTLHASSPGVTDQTLVLPVVVTSQ